MKPHAGAGAAALGMAVVGMAAIVGIGVAGVPFGDDHVVQKVVRSATEQVSVGADSDEVTTTTWTTAPSYRPGVTATPPPPPLD